MSNIVIGTETNFVNDIRDVLQAAENNRQDFVICPLFHPRFRRDSHGISENRDGPLSRSDRLLECKDWIANVVGKTSEWLDLDNPSDAVRKASEEALKQEFSWACHLGLQAVLLPFPNRACPNFARCVQQMCSKAMYQQIWIRIPLILPLHYNCSTSKNSSSSGLSYENETAAGITVREEKESDDGWLAWDNIRQLCNHNIKLFIALEMEEDLPDDMESLLRWRGEPVKALLLSTKIFLTNKTGYPVLSKRHQQVIQTFLDYRVQIVVKGRSRHVGSESLEPYIVYIKHLHAKHVNTAKANAAAALSESSHGSSRISFIEEDRLTSSYRDYLQAPLQPLMDNLESQTYEVFERDPVKYERYQTAITRALSDLKDRREGGTEMDLDSPPTAEPPKPIIITVVGAGRGPLVQCALSAASAVDVPVTVYAVEKNTNAIITLRNRKITERWTNVHIVSQDMRLWQPPELADILVSELLGSWGDNELSPECLDGAQRCLKSTGVSIPAEYTSFIAPISSSKLWTSARDLLDGKGLETPYVVKLHNYHQVARAAPLFVFKHPCAELSNPTHNTRYGIASFQSSSTVTLHGLAGTFHSVLYGDVYISIEPETHSPGMFSWFPLFIPFAAPVRVEAGERIEVHVWRCVDDRKVWYEWCLSSPVCTAIQNPNGRSYWIGL